MFSIDIITITLNGVDKMCKNNGVPNPWIPVKADENQNGCSISMWGREYKIEKNLLFSSVNSLGEELLSSPIRVKASEEGKEIDWQDIDVFLGEANDEKATVYATAQSDAFIINTSATVEFDGCATVDIKLMPRGYTVPQLFGLEKKEPAKTNLDYLHIEIPIKKKFAELYHLYPSNIMPDETGDTSGSKMYSGSGILPERGMYSGFSSVIFLGNDEKGLFTYAQSDKNWQPESKEKAIKFSVKEDEVVITLCLLDSQPEDWAEINVDHGQYQYPDVCYRLAFQATPVKPFPANPYEEKRLHIDCFKKIPQDYGEFLSGSVIEGENESVYDRMKRLGVTTLVLHEKWNQIQNYWKLTKRTSEQLKTIIKECHSRGIKVVPYFGYEISTMSDIWYDKSELYKRKGSEMKKGLGWYRFPAQREHHACYESPIADAFADGLEKLVDEYDFDGVYLDGTAMVWDCKNTEHGCGYYDKEGVLHPTYPIYGVRRLMRRLYEIFESRGKTINCHVSDCLCLAAVSFAHSLWLGEYIQYGLVKQGADSVPEGYLRATHSGRNFGLPTEFIVYENKPIWSFEDAFAFSLIHGVLPRPNDAAQPLEQISQIWSIIDSFPISDSLWCPYFEKDKIPFKSDNPQVKISGYKHTNGDKEEWLLFIANSKTKEIENCNISGFDGFALINAYSNEPIANNGGKVSLELNRFGHYILKLERIR